MLTINKIKKLEMKVIHKAPNQSVIVTKYGSIFQSYDSKVAFRPSNGDTITLGRNWDYSNTTKKHLGQWLGMNTAEIRKQIKEGSIIYDDDLI